MDAAWCISNGLRHVPAWVDVNGVERARNHAVNLAESINADYLLMQDADTWSHGSCVGSLLRTMREHRAAAVAAAVALRNRGGCNVEPSRPGERYIANEAGTALMLLDMKQIADVPRPLFVSRTKPDGVTKEIGEDIYFCRHIRAHGKLLAVDYTLTTAHATQDVSYLAPPNANTERLSVGSTTQVGQGDK